MATVSGLSRKLAFPRQRGRHSAEEVPLVHHSWYDGFMLKLRMKREAEQNARAMKRLTQIEMSIKGLGNEDLLDLADVFAGKPETLIAQYAFAEMSRRKISL
jgi:hypothetical protein